MKYVKHFTINGINTTQVGCIELNGRPNAATVGAVGLLGIDVTSPTHDVYKCVAVNGSIYTWELLSSGMSVLSANITGEGGETKTFPYSDLRIPNNYLIKVGDLILDSEGYLYQISAIGNESCDTTYTSVHLAGGGNGKDYKLKITDGKLQLVTESGAVISTVDYSSHDDETIVKNADGKSRVIGVYTIGGTLMRFFVGTQAEYEALTDKDNLFAIITDDPAPAEFQEVKDTVNKIVDGTITVGKSTKVWSWSSLKPDQTGTSQYWAGWQVLLHNNEIASADPIIGVKGKIVFYDSRESMQLVSFSTLGSSGTVIAPFNDGTEIAFMMFDIVLNKAMGVVEFKNVFVFRLNGSTDYVSDVSSIDLTVYGVSK